MARNIVWGSTEINSRAIASQYFFCDLFYLLEGRDIASYMDDTTPYNTNLTQELGNNELEQTSSILFKWFNNNYMKVNSDKSHLVMSRNKSIANIDNNRIKSPRDNY